MKRLIIGEKASIVASVVAVLSGTPFKKGPVTQVGDDYLVPLAGHALEQAMPDEYLPDDLPTNANGNKLWRASDLPIIPGPADWILHPKAKMQANISAIESLLKEVDEVVHLGDPDAEGQLIVDELLEFFGNTKPVRRLLINDPHEKKVREALANLRDNNEPQFRAWHMWAKARSRYDWLFGLNFTRAATLRAQELGYDGGPLTVGSVQTPLLKLVVDRDRAIENFKPIPFYALVATVDHENGTFQANWKPNDDQAGLDDAGRLVDGDVAKGLVARLSGKVGAVVEYERADRKTAPPLPLALNELTIAGVRQFGYTGAQVLEAAQTLYEKYKVTSYPRTENRFLSEVQHQDAPVILAAVAKNVPDLAPLIEDADPSIKSKAFNDKKMEGNPHYGLVPTERVADLSALTEIERNVYQLIVRSYIAMFYPHAVDSETKIELTIDGERFATSGKTPVSPGWRAIYKSDDDEPANTQADGDKQILPLMQRGDAAACRVCEALSRKTSAPERYDEALLLAAMKNLYKFVDDAAAKERLKPQGGDDDGALAGIGTPATRAAIIAEARERGLLQPYKTSKTKLQSSEAARGLIDALPGVVKDPVMAGLFKLSLDAVASGEMTFDAFMERTTIFVTKIVHMLRTASMNLPVAPTVPCPKCKTGLLRQRKSEKGLFWGCSNFRSEPSCDAAYPDANGQPNFKPPAKRGMLRGFSKPGIGKKVTA
ncbi:DNA topoisomerase [Burkholderia ubonensis]|uniref:DNA topoisomerase n=1 Tax=Burkholderia ubonensis TaxID=101571 RepID=UPI000757E2EE|nr:DNA topoisomerase [Burkholderia ubonensis]KWE97905.1 DNA topoisomerase [Burkholderia ubonensis]